MLPLISYFYILSIIISSQSIQAIRTPSPMYTINPKNHTIQTRHEFEKLRNASKGTFTIGISKLKKYFHHFGYSDSHYTTNITDLFDSNLESSILNYQSKLGLSVTGHLDSPTISELISPRCGVSEKYVFFTGQPRWIRNTIPMTLTYALSPKFTITTLTTSDIRGAFRRAFSHWEQVIPVKFMEKRDDYEYADIRIGFYNGDHGDGEPFDGVLGVLAHAFSPMSGRLHLDSDETWAVDFETEKSRVAVDLESVATHEIGHLLGLGHSGVKEAIMYPNLKPRERKVELKVDDIRGVQALYGMNPNFSLEAFSESDMSSSSRGGGDWSFCWLMVLVLWLCM